MQAIHIAQAVDRALHNETDLVVNGQNPSPDEDTMKEVVLLSDTVLVRLSPDV